MSGSTVTLEVMGARGVVWKVLLGAAIVLVVVGTGVFLLAPASFGYTGWYAYSPLSSTSFSFDGMYPLTPGRAAGAGVVVVGLVIAAGVVGWLLGRRSGRA